MIYIDENIWNFDLQEALAAIPPWRREYALRYRQELDQRLCVAAYLLLQRALRQQYGIGEPPRLVFTGAGKPILDGHPDIHFSLSHCRLAVACAVSDTPVGIDVEAHDHYDPEVAQRVMNQQEMHQIITSANPEVTFTRLWTMKESFYKLTGASSLKTGNHAGDDIDIPNLLDQATHCRFTTIVHPQFTVTRCTSK